MDFDTTEHALLRAVGMKNPVGVLAFAGFSIADGAQQLRLAMFVMVDHCCRKLFASSCFVAVLACIHGFIMEGESTFSTTLTKNTSMCIFLCASATSISYDSGPRGCLL